MSEDIRYVIGEYRKLKGSSESTDAHLAFHCLLNNTSYRLPASAAHDPLIGFRELLRTARKLVRPQTAFHPISDSSTHAILGGLFREEQLIVNYVTRSSGEKQRLFFAKDYLPGFPSVSFPAFMRWLLFAIPISVRCIFSSRRANLALLLREVVENAGLLYWVRSYGIKHLYDFIPYEKDGNFLSILLMSKGVEVIKIPSPGPLATHNQTILGTRLVLSSPYQEEEVAQFNTTVRVNSIERWIPERAFGYIDRYASKPFTPPAHSIGFYSHGSWIRQKEDHAEDGLNISAAEQQLLNDLAKFLNEQPQFGLTIFLHPREKKDGMLSEAKDHYHQLFPNQALRFADPSVATAQAFETCDIALGAFSTILYERLFCGFKTLVGNYSIPGFPLKGSSLESICVHRYDMLQRKLLQFSALSSADFFKETGLMSYHYSRYPYFSQQNSQA